MCECVCTRSGGSRTGKCWRTDTHTHTGFMCPVGCVASFMFTIKGVHGRRRRTPLQRHDSHPKPFIRTCLCCLHLHTLASKPSLLQLACCVALHSLFLSYVLLCTSFCQCSAFDGATNHHQLEEQDFGITRWLILGENTKKKCNVSECKLVSSNSLFWQNIDNNLKKLLKL